MTEDQQPDRPPDQPDGEDSRVLGTGSSPISAGDRGDDDDLRELFRVSAPPASPVDIDRLWLAARAGRSSRARLAWPHGMHRSGSVPDRAATVFLPTRRIMITTLKIATATLMAVCGWIYFAVFPPAEASAFAEMAQKLRNAHTLSYRTSTEIPTLKAPMSMKFFFKEPNLMRLEGSGGVVTVVDGVQGKQLVLDPTSRTAMLLEGKGSEPPRGAGGLLERLRQLTQGDAKAVGEKVIGGVRALGYLVKKHGSEMTIWVDPATRLPVQMDVSDRFMGQQVRSTASDFQIDPELDDALFRLDPPAGYTVRKSASDILGMDEKTFLDPEKATADYLRNFAEKTGGRFPKRLDVLSEFDQVFPKKQVGSLLDGETLRVVQSLTRFMMATRPLNGKFGYRSEGVKLGDADKIIFWYRPEGATTYRALYGDLHAADVPEDKLPVAPKP